MAGDGGVTSKREAATINILVWAGLLAADSWVVMITLQELNRWYPGVRPLNYMTTMLVLVAGAVIARQWRGGKEAGS